MQRIRSHHASLVPAAILPVLAIVAIARPAARATGIGGAGAPEPRCECELRSWTVAGRGRHLLLEIDCPDEFDDLDGVVEFTTAAHRDDYDWTRDQSGAPRIARMTRGVRLRPFLLPAGDNDPAERLEARWTITRDKAACLQRDRLFERQYILLGPNSNSAMAAVLDACGLDAPGHVRNGAGMLGEFPGVDMHPGAEIDDARWHEFGLLFVPE
ncbi:MAG: hypothetical protein ACF8QF_03290 [Phycisphaerales bacterium]